MASCIMGAERSRMPDGTHEQGGADPARGDQVPPAAISDVFAAEVEKIVKDTYGEVAVCKIAHSQKLIAHVAEEDLDLTYRNEAALTVALMGLMAEESLIAQRLGKLGRKKSAA